MALIPTLPLALLTAFPPPRFFNVKLPVLLISMPVENAGIRCLRSCSHRYGIGSSRGYPGDRRQDQIPGGRRAAGAGNLSTIGTQR